jgi:hypothetical protein
MRAFPKETESLALHELEQLFIGQRGQGARFRIGR